LIFCKTKKRKYKKFENKGLKSFVCRVSYSLKLIFIKEGKLMDNEYADTDALELLGKLKTEVFDDSNAQIALAMGRPVSEIEAWFEGDEEIDEDAEMKIHGLAQERLGEE